MIDVLVVDDEKHVRNLLVRMISTMYECQPMEAESVEEALKICDKHKFDVITTDIKFNGEDELDGKEFIKRLRLRGIFTPVLIISAFATPEDIAEVCKYTPVDYLAKPFTQDELRKKLKSLLEYQKESFEKYLREAEGLIHSNFPGDLDKGEQLVRVMFSLMPSSPIPHYLMAEIIEKRGNHELAERHRNAARALDVNQRGYRKGEEIDTD
ncbi:MAG: response regulator [Fervidobacterium sp.]|uniref:Response regulator receiver domain-containing protein n=1 Tax=Fervidobacterium gondwanense DSM 13020 TaxID=1121883 RepID=A0A1M7RZH4_FERGO|nr:response regulator [Fervidobacterium gondwanense]UXF00136.1 histidine kinase [Fervidobacterium riparium]SHN51462.1 Response regulator receiver domain-containing protein [Fervidobacterium gondwanense DSM 13020]